MKHYWQHYDFGKGRKKLGLTACARCGVVQNVKNKDADTCKGYVKVGPRVRDRRRRRAK